jgi:hypothetical protein
LGAGLADFVFPFGTAVFRTGVLPAFGFFGTGLRRTLVLFFCDDVVGFLAMLICSFKRPCSRFIRTGDRHQAIANLRRLTRLARPLAAGSRRKRRR